MTAEAAACLIFETCGRWLWWDYNRIEDIAAIVQQAIDEALMRDAVGLVPVEGGS